jgi:hypothetical protein
LPIFPGLLRYDEIVAGQIRHAIRFTVPQTQEAFVWPARHEASSHTSAAYPPMGARFRLKASFDISSFSATNQIILTALKHYGMLLADNGSSWYISGAPDSRWNNDDLHVLNSIAGSNFEAVDAAPLMLDPNSGQAMQNSVSVSVTPPSATVQVNAKRQFSATVTGNSNQAVTWDVNGVVGGNSVVGFIDSISGLYSAPTVVPGAATVTVHAISKAISSAVGSASVTITAVTAPLPDFSIGVSAGPGSVAAGASAAFTVSIAGIHGFSGTVSFQASGLPAGVTGTFNSTTVTGSGSTTLTVKIPSNAPAESLAITVTGSNGSQRHAATASLSVTAGGGTPAPAPASVTPNSGNGLSHAFVFAFSDASGATNITSSQIDINATLVAQGACYFYYSRQSGSIYLANDAGTWQSPLAIGNAGTLQNSQCALNAGASSVSMSGSTLMLQLALTFKAKFAGSKKIYMEVRNASHDSGWVQKGAWTVP